MPWTVSDVDQFKKGLTAEQKRRWVAIANGVLNDCMDSGKSEEDCAPLAIRTANSQVETNTAAVILCQTEQPTYIARELTYEGKTHLVIPVVMMVEGVHNGSRGPVLHSAEELGKIVKHGTESLLQSDTRPHQKGILFQQMNQVCYWTGLWEEYFMPTWMVKS